MQYKMFWYQSKAIHPNHLMLPVKQVYCWINTQDNQIIAVSKNGTSWQLPGGHPQANENNIDALVREVYEETGLKIDDRDNISFFGYYMVEDIDDNQKVVNTYLQLRYKYSLMKNSNEIILGPNERAEDTATGHILHVKAFAIEKLLKTIPWLGTSAEFKTYSNLSGKNATNRKSVAKIK